MSYQAMKRHGGTLNAYWQGKGADLRRLPTVWFQHYDILEKENYGGSKKISGSQGLRGREGGRNG